MKKELNNRIGGKKRKETVIKWAAEEIFKVLLVQDFIDCFLGILKAKNETIKRSVKSQKKCKGDKWKDTNVLWAGT